MDRNNRPPFHSHGNPTYGGYPPPRPRLLGPGQVQGQGVRQQLTHPHRQQPHAPENRHYQHFQQQQQHYPYNPQSFCQPEGQFPPHPSDFTHQYPQPHQQPPWQRSPQRFPQPGHHQNLQQRQQQRPDHRHERRRQQQRHQQGTRRPGPESPRGDGVQASGSIPQSGVTSGSCNQPTGAGASTAGVSPRSSSAGSSSQPAGSSATGNTPRPDDSSHATESVHDAEKSSSPTGLSHKEERADERGLLQDSEQEHLGAESGPSEENKESASDSDPRRVESPRSTEEDSTSEKQQQQHAGVVTPSAQCGGGQGRVLDTQEKGQVEDTTQRDSPREETEAADAKKQKSSSKRKKSGKGQGQEGRAAGGADVKSRSEKEQLQLQQAKELYESKMLQKTPEMLGHDPSLPNASMLPPVHFNKSAANWSQPKVRDTSKPPDAPTSDTPTPDLPAPDPASSNLANDPTSDTPTPGLPAPDPASSNLANDPTSDIATDRAERTVEQCMKFIANTTTGLEMTALYNYSFDNYLAKSSTEARKQHDELFQDEEIVSASPVKAGSRDSQSTSSFGACGGRGANETADSVCCEKTSTAAEVSVTPRTAAGSDSVSGGISSPTASCEVASEQVSPQARSSPTNLATEEGEPPATSGETTTTASTKKKNRRNKKKKEQKDKSSVEQPTQLSPEKGEKESSANAATDADSRHPGNPMEKSDSSPASSQAAPQGTKSKPRGGKPNLFRQFPKPRPLFPNPEQMKVNRGDIDVLLVYQGKGCVAMEIKAVGYNKSDPTIDSSSSSSEQPADGEYEVVRSKIYLALQQLTKAENFLRHVSSDLADELPVMKTIGLPNLTRGYVLDACSEDETLQQELCRCLRALTLEEALTKVLCSDDIDTSLKSPSFDSAAREASSHDALLRWWQNVIKEDNSGEETAQEGAGVTCPGRGLSKDVYNRMVARLAGPYSRVTVESCRGAAEARTVGDCVHLTGLRFGRSLLRDDQLRIFESKEPFVYISGPPGSGKTLVLGFKGVEWARQGDHVVVFIPQGSGWGKLISQTLYQRIKEYASLPAQPYGQPQGKKAKESDSQFSLLPPAATKTTTTNPKKKVLDQLTPSSTEKPALGKTKTSSSSKVQAQETRGEPLSKNSSSSELGSIEGQATDDSLALPEEETKGAVDTATIHRAGQDRVSALEATNSAEPQTTSPPNREDFQESVDSDGAARASAAPRPVSVHTATVMKTEDTKKFVDDLLERFSDRPLRMLVDEGPNKINVKHLHGLLANSTRTMKEAAEALSPLVLELEEGGESGSARDTTHESGRRQGERVKEHEKAKALIKKVRHHLHIVGERLEIFQPPHGRPPLTQTEEWKTMVTGIADSRQLILSLLIRLEATSPSLKPDDEESSTEPSEASSEQSLDGREGDGPEGQPETGTKDDLNAADAPSSASRVLAALNKLEGQMLDASGWMFNVETQMDFLVIRDVLSLLVQEKGKRDVSVWSTGVTQFYKPENFTYETLTHCLRCPPKIQRVLGLVEKDMAECPNYSYILDSLQYLRLPLPTDGPEVKLLDHSSHLNEARDILDCRQCGDNLANYLVDTLRVGCSSGGLQPDDVNISGSLDICSVQGRPLLQALEDKGIQLQFEQQGVNSPPPYPGKAFVIGGCSFQGLETKIVVFIPDVSRIPNDTSDVKQFPPTGLPDWLKTMARWNRIHLWFVASRCLGQLIVFHV